MANRKQRRKEKNYKKTDQYPKIKLSEETKKGIILFIIIGVILVGVYFATVYLVNKGNLSTYEPSSEVDAVITYDEINVGMVFNRTPEEYYVAFENFSDKNRVEYSTLIKDYSSNENNLPIYKVDMLMGFNQRYYDTKTNPYVQDVRELKIKTPTLMKIKDGTNILYIEDINKIKSELTN